MKLVGLVDSTDHVCCRYRLAAFQGPLAAAGHSLDLVALPRMPFSRFRAMLSVGSYDAVILQRRLMPKPGVALLRYFARRLIFDIDDAIWLRDSYHAKGFDCSKRLARFRATCQSADVVVAGNDFLAAQANAIAPGRATVIPTCVEPAEYPAGTQPKDGVFRLVWVGSKSTLRGLKAIAPLLDAVGAAVPGVRLKVICDTPLTLNRLPVDFVPWNGRTETAEIAAADAGIAWMPDDAWSRGKCGLKVLQYMAAGLPVIANPVGVHATMVRPGVTGFHATTADEWISAVRTLKDQAGLKQSLGHKGRRIAERDFSVAAGALRWCETLAILSALPTRQAG